MPNRLTLLSLSNRTKKSSKQQTGKGLNRGKCSRSARQFTPDILSLLSTVQSQLQRHEILLKESDQADKRKLKRNHTSEYEEAREEQLLDEIQTLKEVVRSFQESEVQREQKQRQEAPAQPFAALQDPEYLVRFENLMKAGQRNMAEVAEALEATKERGTYSAGRADFYLKAKAMSRVKQVLLTANSSLQDDQDPIDEHSKLGCLIQAPGNEDSVDIVTKLRDVHARARTKTAHCATPAIGASNLVNSSVIKNDATMGRKGLAFLSAVAYAVCEDCTKCTELRQQAEKQRELKAKQAADAESLKKSKGKGTGHKRLKLPFKPSDSRIDKSLPRGFCVVCKGGWNEGPYLYFCQECKRGIHLLCTDWEHIRLVGGGPTWFACYDCLDARNRAIDNGDSTKEYVIVDELGHELAPQSTEAVGGPGNGAPKPSRPSVTGDHPGATGTFAQGEKSELEKRGGGVGDSNAPPPHHTPHHHHHYPHANQTLTFTETPTRNSTGSETILVPESGRGNDSRPSYQVKDYFTWEMVPKDWAPKPDGPRFHPEKGYSRVAYQNWRRKNVTLRDQVVANKSSFGPLTRSLSGEMRAFLGKQFLKETALSWLWPQPTMDERSIDRWVASDPEFKWVERIPDPILLELLDKRFGVKNSELFLSRKFYSNLPLTDSHGDVNYHADLFNRWAADWSTELMELQKAGVSFEGVDLKHTLLNAMAPYKVIHDKAVCIATSSVFILLAALCDWVIEEEEKAIARRNQKASLLKDEASWEQASKPAHAPLATTTKHSTQQQANASSKASATALMTQLASHLGVSNAASGDQGAGKVQSRPLPTHLRVNGHKVFCRGCSNDWDRSRSIPCYKGCKYSEHPEYNRDCKDKEPTKRTPLTWKGFRERYPSVTPPQSLLRWEEYDKRAQKRPREDGQRDP